MKTNLSAIIRNFAGKRVAVIGDLMLDVYLWGRADRISPEAPVPIVQVGRTTNCLGGAANVMRNIVTLGGSTCALGVLGRDADAAIVNQRLEFYGIDPKTVQRTAKRRTTVKQRIIAGTQQLMRLDFEDTTPIEAKLRDKIAAQAIKLIEQRKVDAVIFEDYGKGVLSESLVSLVAQAAAKAGIFTMLDPKPGHLAAVKGLTVLKPNRLEAFGMAKLTDVPDADAAAREKLLREAAKVIQEQWNPQYLIISLAAEGMALFDRTGQMLRIPTRAREVFDVSGAGDTLTAAFTLAMISGAKVEEAAEIANAASGIVVGKVGTVTVEKSELLKSLNSINRS